MADVTWVRLWEAGLRNVMMQVGNVYNNKFSSDHVFFEGENIPWFSHFNSRNLNLFTNLGGQ